MTRALSRELIDVLIRARLVAVLAVFGFRIFVPFLNLMIWALILAITSTRSRSGFGAGSLTGRSDRYADDPRRVWRHSRVYLLGVASDCRECDGRMTLSRRRVRSQGRRSVGPKPYCVASETGADYLSRERIQLGPWSVGSFVRS